MGAGSRYSNQISAGATFAFLAVTIILLVSPRGESYKSDIEEEISGYDQTVTQRALMMVSMVLAVLTAAGGMVAFHLIPPIHAKPIDYQADIVAFEKRSR